MTDNKIKKILLEGQYISEEDIKEAEVYAKSHKSSFLDYLFSENILSKNILGQAIAEDFGVAFADLSNEKINDDVFYKIPEVMARSKGVVALKIVKDKVKLGVKNPKDLQTMHIVSKKFGMEVIPYFVFDADFENVLSRYKSNLKDRFENITNSLKDESRSREENDEAIIEIVDTLIQYGYDNKASDIHIEPYEKKILVRFRIDGIMHDVLDIDKKMLELILTRIKIMAKLRTDEHRAAQDGKLRYKADDEVIDVRVSILPITQGEKTVMRLLSSKSRQFGLSDLGFSEVGLKKVKKAIKNPHGMILVTGPTGSGKTTTLYSVLKILNKRDVNIATIEDPVEYDIEGVNQIQVNKKTKLTFASGLRSIVRQDPDIIMIGEIRDEETAGIAVNAALTGHLVLSTLHTNDAATTLPRLLDMKIEPFLVASTVNLVVAQRLVRKVCKSCRVSYKPSVKEIKTLETIPNVKDVAKELGYTNFKKANFYKGAGCKICGDTGYHGRVGIYEVLEMNENIKELILKHASSDEITKVAKKNGMIVMLQDGIGKILNGETTIEEVFRVAR